MADLARLERALRNADAAGDAEGARVIAQAIRQAQGTTAPTAPDKLFAGLQNTAAGVVRGAGSVGATLMAPMDMLNAKLTGQPLMARNQERRQGITDALAGLGADTDSLAFGAGKLGGEIAGTMGVGPIAAGAARSLPSSQAVAPFLQAIETAGMRAGGMTGARGMGVRVAGGATTGGAAAGLVDPRDAALGMGIGAALPPGLSGAHALGRLAGAPFKSQDRRALEALAQALERPEQAATALRGAQELVPGSQPTVAQVLRTPQASALERIVSESPGGSALKERYIAQNAARLSALEQVAPTNPVGMRQAQDDFGTAALQAIRTGDEAARAKTRAAYQAIPQDEAMFYLPDLGAVRDDVFTRGSFGNRAAADQAVRAAEDVSSFIVPAGKAGAKGPAATSLAQAVRKAGGLSITNHSGFRGELARIGEDHKNVIRRQGGLSPARMAERMREAGYLQTDDAADLIDSLRREATGDPMYSNLDDLSRQWGAERDRFLNVMPEDAQTVPRKVTMREFEGLRSSIGNESRAAALDPARAKEKMALDRMREALDDRVNEVVRGDGAMDEVLPLGWADQLTDARRLKSDQVGKFRTGPQAEAFRTGADGLPKVQGGEFSRLVWGNRPGLAEDIGQFRKIADDHPNVMQQFRTMITTEGGSTATAAGNLGNKFARWVDNMTPGLRATFNEREVKALQRIAADIKRAEKGAAAGGARGSPTYQNVSNAMSLGLLDNSAVRMLATRTPVLGQFTGPMLDGLRTTAREEKARRLAALLGSPEEASNALTALLVGPHPALIGAEQGLLRAAPVLPSQ